MATHEEATAHKQEAANVAVANLAPKIWRYVLEPDAQSAADFLNLPPAQVAGAGGVLWRLLLRVRSWVWGKGRFAAGAGHAVRAGRAGGALG